MIDQPSNLPPKPAQSGSPRYPEIVVQLSGGHDGNAFAILGTVRRALREHQISAAEIQQFTNVATSGDYDHLLTTVMRWVRVT